MQTLDEYASNKAIVFQGIDFLKIFIFLMNKRYDKLASKVVNINNAFSSKEELIEVMRYRTQRIRATRN
jgi:hypothetical protein